MFPKQRPREERKHEVIDTCRACRHDPRDVAIGDEYAVQDRVVTPRRAHAQGIPGLLHPVAFGVARHERVHDCRLGWVGHIHAVEAEIRPDWGEASERLAAREAISALHPVRLGRREQHRDVVAALGVTCREDRAATRLLQDPPQRRVARAPQVRRDTGPIDVHVDRQRRCGRVGAEPALLANNLCERQAAAPQLHRHRDREIAR